MNKNGVLTRVAAIVTALEETGGTPESMLYIFCEMDMEDWHMIKDILIKSGLMKCSGFYCSLTEQGIKTAKELNSVINKDK